MARGIRVGVLAVVVVALVSMLAGGCRGATEVTLLVRTAADLPCSSVESVSIVVAATPGDAEARLGASTLTAKTEQGTCDADGHTIGTLVVTPGDSAGAVVVAARLVGDESAPCAPPDYKGCIVARRTFTFVSHANVTLPVSLDISCLDVPCGVVTSCRSGMCVSSNADCSADTGTCTSPAEPAPEEPGADGSADGDAVADAFVPDGARPDAEADADAAVVAHGQCPTTPTTTTCQSDEVCCFDNGYKCQKSCLTGTTFGCFGKGDCDGGYCCYEGSSVTCDLTNNQACSQGPHHYLCRSDLDCPPSHHCASSFDGVAACDPP